MEFVISVLVEVFHKSAAQAAAIMLAVHEQGMGVCGVYPQEVAETKVVMVHSRARRAGYPLKSTMEEAG
jgi:ATP-dependent Clp protease adaptor protein ClpS